MKPIERLISIRHDIDVGELFVFSNRHRDDYKVFLSLEMAQEERRKFDQRKQWWTKIGIHDEYLFTSYSQSRVKKDQETGLWYVILPLDDDILVSDLYPKKKVYEIKSYLDENNWSKKALNTLKRRGMEGMQKYWGILPTKVGYQIKDFQNKNYGVFETLEEAVKHRDKLLQNGVII